jgi:hypothetical protein
MALLLKLKNLQDELAQVRRLLEQPRPPTDTVGLMWESRRRALEAEIAEIEKQEPSQASVALIFEGDPVVGAQEIRVDFAAKALENYQNLISTVFADQISETLGSKGPLPHASRSRLYLSELIHGSMGFILDELPGEQIDLLATPLRQTVEKTSEIIEGLADPSLEVFEETLTRLKPRVVKAVRSLVLTLADYGAETRIVGDKDEISLDRSRVRSLRERLAEVLIEELDETLNGILRGVLPEEHTYEFTPDGVSGTLHGPVSDEMVQRYVVSAAHLVERRGRGTFKLIRTVRAGRLVKEQRILEAFHAEQAEG